MYKLSKREKVLLALLLLVIIIAGALRFVIFPVFGAFKNIKAEINELTAQKEEGELSVEAAVSFRDIISKNELRLDEIKARFVSSEHTEVLGRDIERMLSYCGISPLSVSFSDPYTVELGGTEPVFVKRSEIILKLICENEAFIRFLEYFEAFAESGMYIESCDASYSQGDTLDVEYVQAEIVIGVYYYDEAVFESGAEPLENN